MDSFETWSGLYGLAGIGGLEPSTPPAAPNDAQRTTSKTSNDLSDLTDLLNLDSTSKPAVAAGGVSALEGGCELDLGFLAEALPDLPEESPSAADADELPEGWDDAMMDMTTPQLNRCIKRRGLSKEQAKLIKACRRRLMNRVYAKTSRKRRIEKQVALAEDHEQISLRSKTLNQEVQQLLMGNSAIMRRLEAVEAFTAMLVDSGKMTHDEIAVFLKPRDA
jgi:hypothetical protein